MKCLVILAAGENSLHEQWDLRPYKDVIVDILILQKRKESPKEHQLSQKSPRDDNTLLQGNPKWSTVKHALPEYNSLIKTYDYLWIPDDDIQFTKACKIAQMVYFANKHKLYISQPALVGNEYHRIILASGDKKTINYEYFVDSSCPIIKQDFFEDVVLNILLNDNSSSSWGIDIVWSVFCVRMYGPKSLGIMNQFTIEHIKEPHVFEIESYRKKIREYYHNIEKHGIPVNVKIRPVDLKYLDFY